MKRIDIGQTLAILANLGVLVGFLLPVFDLNQDRKIAEGRTSMGEQRVGIEQ